MIFFDAEDIQMNTLLYRYATEPRSVDLDTLLSELEVDPQGKTGLLLANGELGFSAQREWAGRLTYWCSQHRREYQMVYDKDRHLTMLACTNTTWTPVRKLTRRVREAVRYEKRLEREAEREASRGRVARLGD